MRERKTGRSAFIVQAPSLLYCIAELSRLKALELQATSAEKGLPRVENFHWHNTVLPKQNILHKIISQDVEAD
jgi:hypothetical protein